MKKLFIFCLMLLLLSPCWAGINFNGDVDYIKSASSVVDFGTSDFTIAFWGKSSQSTGDYYHFFSNKDDYSDNFVRVRVNNATGKTQVYCEEGGGTNNTTTGDTNVTTDNVRRHFIITRAGSVVTIYLNNVLDGSTDSAGQNGDLGTTDFFWVGWDGTNAGYYWGGEINEFAVWNSLLTSDERSLLYNSKIKGIPLQIQPSNLQWYLSLNDYPEGHGTLDSTTFVDRSSNGVNGAGVDADNDSDVIAETYLSYP